MKYSFRNSVCSSLNLSVVAPSGVSTPALLAYAAKARLSLGKQGPPKPNP